MPAMDGVIDEKRERVSNARAKALAARTAGVGKKGPVMPSMAKQLVTIAEPAASEAYTFGYRPMSWETTRTPASSFLAHLWSATTARCLTRMQPRGKT